MRVDQIEKRMDCSQIEQYIDNNFESMQRQIYCLDWPDKHEYYLVIGNRKIKLGFRWTTHREWMIIEDSSEYRDLGYRYRGYIIIKYSEYKRFHQNQVGIVQHMYLVQEQE